MSRRRLIRTMNLDLGTFRRLTANLPDTAQFYPEYAVPPADHMPSVALVGFHLPGRLDPDNNAVIYVDLELIEPADDDDETEAITYPDVYEDAPEEPMDPQACLRRIVDLYAAICRSHHAVYQGDVGDVHDEENIAELRESLQSLGTWLTRGGFAPAALGEIFGRICPGEVFGKTRHLRDKQYAIVPQGPAPVPELTTWKMQRYDTQRNVVEEWNFPGTSPLAEGPPV